MIVDHIAITYRSIVDREIADRDDRSSSPVPPPLFFWMDFAFARDYRSPARRTRCERINKAEERLEPLTMKAWFLTAMVSADVLLSSRRRFPIFQ